AGAAQALSAAYRLWPSPETLYQLGALALAEGRTIEAQDAMRRYLRDTQDDEASPQRQEAQRILQLLAPPSGEVNIVGERAALVLIDDRLLGVLPLPLPLLLPIGEHRV